MSDKEALDRLRGKHEILLKEVGKVIVGQESVVKEVTMAILAGGHCLLVGVPGLAKTLLVNTIWFEEELLGNNATDFFHTRPVEYAKNSQTFDAEDLF